MNNEKEKWLDNFIAEVVDGWMLGDLERLIKDIPHKKDEAGNCNFPIALYVFSCVEFLGQLTAIPPIDTKKPGYSQKSIIGFIETYFPSNFNKKLQPHKKDFVNVFRNGLAHNYFAKYAGVSRTETDPIGVNSDGMLELDADCFAEAFEIAVGNLKKSIKGDVKLAEQIVDRYNDQYQNNQLRFKTTPTRTYTSTASLAHPSMVKNLKTTTTLPPPPITNKSGSSK